MNRGFRRVTDELMRPTMRRGKPQARLGLTRNLWVVELLLTLARATETANGFSHRRTIFCNDGTCSHVPS